MPRKPREPLALRHAHFSELTKELGHRGFAYAVFCTRVPDVPYDPDVDPDVPFVMASDYERATLVGLEELAAGMEMQLQNVRELIARRQRERPAKRK